MQQEVENLKHLLDENNINYKIITHEPVYTSEEAARIRGVPLSTGVKAMVVKSDKGFFLVLVSGDKKIDYEKLQHKVGRARLASPDEVFRITGCEIGSVHPFGNLYGLRVFMDRRILDNETVNFNAGMHEVSLNISPHDMIKIIKPEIMDIAKE